MANAELGSSDPGDTHSRGSRIGRSFELLGRELRFAVRSLRRAPGFSVAVFITLVLCIGPNMAILSTLYALLLRPLPFPDAGKLVTVLNVIDKRGGQLMQSSVPQYRDFKARADLFAGLAVILPENITLDDGGTPIRVENDWVSSDFFEVLGVKPVLGRFFTPEEETRGRDNVLVLSHAYWISHYNADPGVIGQNLHSGGEVYSIIGVAPESLASLSPPTSFFQPYAPDQYHSNPQARYVGDATLYARLKRGVTPGAALAQLSTLERHFRDNVASPQLRALLERDAYRLEIQQLKTGGLIGSLPSLWLLQGGALLVLLIGAVNVINLFLARMNAKRPELATRVALGAGKMTLLRQALTESLLLTAMSAIGGVGVAVIAIQIFNRYLPLIERTAPLVTLDFAAIGAILAVALAIALLIGILPLQMLWRTGLRLGDMRTTSSNRRARAVSSTLVTAQVGIAVILLTGAALLIRSFAKVLAVHPGFDAVRIVQGRIALPGRYLGTAAASIDVQRRIVAAFREILGVESVAEVFGYGLVTDEPARPFMIRGESISAGANQPLVNLYGASPDVFSTLGMRVLVGRGFNEADDFVKNPVVVVDESFAERYFPGRIVVGQEISLQSNPLPDGYKWPRIVGVVTRANLSGLEKRDSPPFIFIPLTGVPAPGFNVLVRSPRPVGDILQEMRAKLREIDPGLPLYMAGSLRQGIDDMLLPRRGITLLLAAFSGLAVLLAAVGLYGVLAYDVSQRTQEIGIRGAIGASRGQIMTLILRQGMWKAGVGLAMGVVGALCLTRYLRSLLFDITAIDLTAYGVVVLTLSIVALVACWVPAWKAAMVEPIIALRAE